MNGWELFAEAGFGGGTQGETAGGPGQGGGPILLQGIGLNKNPAKGNGGPPQREGERVDGGGSGCIGRKKAGG